MGRRRFWRGSFLFHNDTSVAGAGFKAFRPVRSTGTELRAIKNRHIGDIDGMAPFSMQQYELGTDGFYDRMEALINPRPLDPRAMMGTLVDALNESVQRRVNSVQNGEDYKKTHRGVIKMPHGHSIFETSGAWENFSTPSRDMRLLIAIDTVSGFPDKVKRNPERYGSTADAVDPLVAELRAQLDRDLESRKFSYLRSDGSTQKLTVKDVVARRQGLRDGLQTQRLRRDPLGRPRGQRRALQLPQPRPRRPPPAHGQVPRLVRHPHPPRSLNRRRWGANGWPRVDDCAEGAWLGDGTHYGARMRVSSAWLTMALALVFAVGCSDGDGDQGEQGGGGAEPEPLPAVSAAGRRAADRGAVLQRCGAAGRHRPLLPPTSSSSW